MPDLQGAALHRPDLVAGRRPHRNGQGRGVVVLVARQVIPDLVEFARTNLQKAGVANVSVELGNAAEGWLPYAPYDAIVLSASLPVLPEALLHQLKIGGRLVAVVGEAPLMHLHLITRTDENAFNTINVLETVVAPLVNAAQSDKFVF